MPDAAWAVSVHPPSLSREKGQPPVLTSSNPLSTLHRRFAYARLSQSCLPESRSGFPQRSPPWLLTTAACGGLRPAPDCRPRRAHLHPSYSCTCRLDRHARDTRPKADIRPLQIVPRKHCAGRETPRLHRRIPESHCSGQFGGELFSFHLIHLDTPGFLPVAMAKGKSERVTGFVRLCI